MLNSARHKTMDWNDIVNKGHLRICKSADAHQLGVFPNYFGWLDSNTKIGAAVVFQSENDFALGKASLERLAGAKAEGRVVEAHVVFLRRRKGMNGTPGFVFAATIEEMTAQVEDLALNDGNWGPFWWIPAPRGEPNNGVPWLADDDQQM
jgi:hypothetical protein